MNSRVHRYRNVSFATFAALHDLLRKGQEVKVRGDRIRELRNRITVLHQPRERCLFLPKRGGNIFSTVAETIWVLAGRNDVAWLERYLPKAGWFSDDGLTWRGGYGPRLRQWQGVDQLKKVRDLIRAEPTTRRAVMSLFDPACDYVESKDIPCNNWLHWLVREGRLHLNIAIRSNDVIWGFSGVNCFEWSVLQEMMSFWCNVVMGEITYLASSFHLYKRHYRRAERVVAAFRGVTCYKFGLKSPPFRTQLEDLDSLFTEWFRIEEEFRAAPDSSISESDHISDPFLCTALMLCRIHHGLIVGWDGRQLREALEQLPASDLTAAAYEFLGRRMVTSYSSCKKKNGVTS